MSSKFSKFSTVYFLSFFFSADAPANKKFAKSQCEDSAYLLWRQAELDKYKGVDGIGASLGGVVVGLLILSVILLWDCHINSESLGSNGFERFWLADPHIYLQLYTASVKLVTI